MKFTVKSLKWSLQLKVLKKLYCSMKGSLLLVVKVYCIMKRVPQIKDLKWNIYYKMVLKNSMN